LKTKLLSISHAIHASAALLIALSLMAMALPSDKLARLRASEKGFVHPVMSPRVSSNFGSRIHPINRLKRHHNGIDLAAPGGAAIRAITDGIVVFADPYKGYGNLVVLQHKEGLTSHYGHCEKIKVVPGQRVQAGQIIATVGQTGHVTGPHLHFEIRLNGQAQNPEDFIPGLTSSPRG